MLKNQSLNDWLKKCLRDNDDKGDDDDDDIDDDKDDDK